nr:ABC transporter substrate-binding protein [Pseudoruegeria sp. HB172150]
MDPSFSLGIGIDVGLPIVGAPLTDMGDEELLGKAEELGVVNLGFVTDPSMERLVALQPDLIIAMTGDEGLASTYYPMLSQIAPTMLETEVDWRAYYRTLARLSGAEAEVDEMLADFDVRLEDVRRRVPDDVNVSILRITSWDFQVYRGGPDGYAPFALLDEAGVRRSDYETALAPIGMHRPDWEELAQLDGDVLLYIIGGTNTSDTDGRYEEVLNHPLWQMLPAVKAGRVHRIDHGTWMEFNGLRAAHRVLDDIETYVIGTR